MNVTIWDIVNEKWLSIKNVKHIHQACQSCQSLHYFKLDGKKYDTEKYELCFIHNSY